MGRPKAFDTDQVLRLAMELFWARGYEATSTRELLDHMGISRQSLYDTYGGKQQLFVAALDCYRTDLSKTMLAALAQPGASLPEIQQYFEKAVLALTATPDRWGCLMVSSIVERTPPGGEVARRSASHLEQLETLFATALQEASRRGEIARQASSRESARHLTTLAQGLVVMARGGASAPYLRDAVTAALAPLRLPGPTASATLAVATSRTTSPAPPRPIPASTTPKTRGKSHDRDPRANSWSPDLD
jgi:TetR/AcrR family transcriptional repressor of nem operon